MADSVNKALASMVVPSDVHVGAGKKKASIAKKSAEIAKLISKAMNEMFSRPSKKFTAAAGKKPSKATAAKPAAKKSAAKKKSSAPKKH